VLITHEHCDHCDLEAFAAYRDLSVPEEAFRERIVQLVRAVRREPGCLTFTAYEARDTPGRFYLYEVYTDAAAFSTHLQTEHVHTFISTIPT
jgi:quinol monooxygenase YgiN